MQKALPKSKNDELDENSFQKMHFLNRFCFIRVFFHETKQRVLLPGARFRTLRDGRPLDVKFTCVSYPNYAEVSCSNEFSVMIILIEVVILFVYYLF